MRAFGCPGERASELGGVWSGGDRGNIFAIWTETCQDQHFLEGLRSELHFQLSKITVPQLLDLSDSVYFFEVTI